MKIHNTLTGNAEDFVSIKNKQVKMYVCGITPYDETHIGHGRCYVVFDILRRYLKYKGYNVEYVQNFTDIDDKIINTANEKKLHPKDIAEKYISEYFDIEKKLNISPANVYPRVTQHIDDIISAVEQLVKKNVAYVTKTGVYFDIEKFPEYGKLSKRKKEELISGIRIEPDETKKNMLDFALWKFTKPVEEKIFPGWDSPWGKGRPGWHIECSVMSIKYLGETFDIHGGGADLIFPHHENEIAQSESLTGKEFVKYWIHNGFVTINQQKMSKSLKNIFTLNELFALYNPMVIRLYLISQHYRKPLDFTFSEIEQFKSVWERFVNVKDTVELWIKNLKEGELNLSLKDTVDKIITEFETSMDDDLNTSAALAAIHKIVNHLYSLEKKLTQGITKQDVIYPLNKLVILLEDVLGLKLPSIEVPKEIEELVSKREQARKNKDFTTADKIRQQIISLGWYVEDTPFGPKLRKK